MNNQMKDQQSAGHDASHTLPLTIEGKGFTWTEQYITGLAIKKLGNLPPDSELYLTIANPWKDEPISDHEHVDLARPGIEGFYIKKQLEFFIEQEKYSWKKQYISGAEIRKLGGISADSEIYLSIQKPWEDELVLDDARIDLARPGIERFYSVKKCKLVIIQVNGIQREITPGRHTVADIKSIGDVPQSHELEQLVNKKLLLLADDAIVDVKGHEEFFSHVRDGSSS